MLSGCKCLEIGEKQIFIDSLDDRIGYLIKLKQKAEKRKIQTISGIVVSGMNDMIDNTTKLRQDVSNIKICEIYR